MWKGVYHGLFGQASYQVRGGKFGAPYSCCCSNSTLLMLSLLLQNSHNPCQLKGTRLEKINYYKNKMLSTVNGLQLS